MKAVKQKKCMLYGFHLYEVLESTIYSYRKQTVDCLGMGGGELGLEAKTSKGHKETFGDG